MVKRMSAMLLLLLILGLFSPVVVEASTVTYVNQAEKFVFVSEDSDLFEKFKDVMPGDVRKQKIQVKNDSKETVNIYLKIKSINEESEKFLEQLALTIKDKQSVLFKDQLSNQGSFTEFKLLAKLEPKAKMSLDLLLEVPKSLSKEFMNQEAEIEWVFQVEEVVVGELPNTDNLPKTGSTTNALYIVTGLLFILVGKTLFGERKSQNTRARKN